MKNHFANLISDILFRFGFDVRCYSEHLGANPFDVMQELVKNPSVIFDVGANDGRTAIKFSNRFPKTKIESFEPGNEVFGALEKSIKRYKGTIIPHKLAFGDSVGVKELYMHRESGNDSLLPDSSQIGDFSASKPCDLIGKSEVEVTTIDSWCEKSGISYIDILKMDTQGYEMHILDGAKGMLEQSQIGLIYTEVLFVPLYEGQGYFDDIVVFLNKYGYKLYGLYGIHSDKKHGVNFADALFVPKGNN